MTVMIDTFFGLHQYVVRSGLWKNMRPGEKDLYVFLMYKSERNCTRELFCTDAEIGQLVGVSTRTLRLARTKLQERGLMRCRRGVGNKYTYVICDPVTGQPYPGAPKARIDYVKKGTAPMQPMQPQEPKVEGCTSGGLGEMEAPDRLEKYGLPGLFTRSVA